MRPFDVIDISGDAGIRAYGNTLEDAFANAATGMYSLITNPDDIREKEEITVEVESHSTEGLLVSWLNELIFQLDAYGFIGKKIKITEFIPSLTLPPRGGGLSGGEADIFANTQAYILKATVIGEDFDPERHERRLLIKAATYHRLKIEKIGGMWQAEVIFDI